MTAHRVYRGAGLRRRPAGGRRRWIAAAALLGVFGTYVTVMQTSQAAFTATTANPTNTWAAGSVNLTDDDGGASAMFSVANLKPGDTGQRCIVVTYSGSLAAAVKLYGVSVSGSGTLAQYLQLTVELGTGTAAFTGSTGNAGSTCSGTFTSPTTLFGPNALLTTFTASNFATGLGTWSPAASPPSTSMVYRFTWTLPSSTPDAAQTLNASATFTWQAQNT